MEELIIDNVKVKKIGAISDLTLWISESNTLIYFTNVHNNVVGYAEIFPSETINNIDFTNHLQPIKN